MLLTISTIKGYSQNYIVTEELGVDEINGLEFPFEKMAYDKNTKMMYSITANDTNLFFHLRIADEKVQQQCLRHGVTFWIDTSGQKKETMGFTHLGIKPHEGFLPFENQGRTPQEQNGSNPEVILEPFIMNTQDEIQLIGIAAKGSAVFVPNSNPFGISVQSQITDKRVLFYKGTIPLKYLGTMKKLSIGITSKINEQGVKQHSPGKNDQQEGDFGFSTGGPPGGKGPGGGGQYRNNHAMSESNTANIRIWIKNVKVIKHQ